MIRYRNTALSSTDVQAVVCGTGGFNIRGFNIINPNSSDVYVKFYDALAANVTVGTTTPILTLLVPANGSVFEPFESQKVVAFFNTAITLAAVTGLADSSTTAPSTAIHVSIQYSS